MSETPAENPNQAAQPGAEGQPTTEQPAQAQPQAQDQPVSTDAVAQDQPAQPQAQTLPAAADSGETTYPLRLVRRETGETHWNVASGLWEKVAHAETGEPNAEYVLLATIDGVDVKIGAYNAGRVETIVRAQQQAQQQTQG